MKLQAFAVRDSKAEAFFPPFFQGTVGQGERTFVDLCRDGNVELSKHPGDYQLYLVGGFDSETGALSAVIPMVILSGEEVGNG